MQQAADVRPIDAAAYLIRACQKKKESASDRMRREWNLPSLGDAPYDVVYGNDAAAGAAH